MRAIQGSLMMVALVTLGCQIGPNPPAMAPATSPNGTQASVVVRSGRADATVSGELIAVRQDDMLLLTSQGLSRVANDFIQRATFADARPGTIEGPGEPEQRASLAQYSRYPFGLEGERLTRLLAALDQGELIELGR